MNKLIIIAMLMWQTTSVFAMNACDSSKYWRVANSHGTNAVKEMKKGSAKRKKSDLIAAKLDNSENVAEGIVDWVELKVDEYVHYEFSKKYFEHAVKKWKRIRRDCRDDENYQTADNMYHESIDNKKRINKIIAMQQSSMKNFLRRAYKNINPMYIKGIQAMMGSEVEIESLFTTPEKNNMLAKLRKENEGGRYNGIIKSLEYN